MLDLVNDIYFTINIKLGRLILRILLIFMCHLPIYFLFAIKHASIRSINIALMTIVAS